MVHRRCRSRPRWVALLVMCLGAGCGTVHGARPVRVAQSKLAAAVAKGRTRQAAEHVLPAQRAWVHWDAVMDPERRAGTARDLRGGRPVEMRTTIWLGAELPARAVRTDEGWRFAEDPTQLFSANTPRGALRALVWASRAGRYDVLVSLAPRRYRIGLSAEQLEAAWTKGPLAADLRARRDRLAEHLGDPLVQDDHGALLDMGDAGRVHLEREGTRWVVVDF